jgi:hypothetical protein
MSSSVVLSTKQPPSGLVADRRRRYGVKFARLRLRDVEFVRELTALAGRSVRVSCLKPKREGSSPHWESQRSVNGLALKPRLIHAR